MSAQPAPRKASKLAVDAVWYNVRTRQLVTIDRLQGEYVTFEWLHRWISTQKPPVVSSRREVSRLRREEFVAKHRPSKVSVLDVASGFVHTEPKRGAK